MKTKPQKESEAFQDDVMNIRLCTIPRCGKAYEGKNSQGELRCHSHMKYTPKNPIGYGLAGVRGETLGRLANARLGRRGKRTSPTQFQSQRKLGSELTYKTTPS